MEADGKILHGKDLELEVSGMPKTINPSGKGYVDYVKWGDDGKPLGVVEAKQTIVSEKSGKQQAKLYADCLEKMYGQRPVIFYSNGYDIFMWDDLFYPERKVSGFYTKDELQLLVNRRKTRIYARNFNLKKGNSNFLRSQNKRAADIIQGVTKTQL